MICLNPSLGVDYDQTYIFSCVQSIKHSIVNETEHSSSKKLNWKTNKHEASRLLCVNSF